MSSPSRFIRIAAALAILGALPVLAGCAGLRPVYQSGTATSQIAVTYAKPGNRLEQIIYQDLALRLGDAKAGAPLVTLIVSQSASALTSGNVSAPHAPQQMVVSARITITDVDGKVLFRGSRSQTADYTTDAQSLSNQQAGRDAAERAAKLLADTIRLEIIAALS